MTDAASRFAVHALTTSFRDLPDDAVGQAKTFILDSLGVGIAGSSVETATGLFQIAATWGTAPEAQVWGRSTRLSAPAAAFLNAWQMHNQEFDCLHEPAVVHGMASVLPACLAAAERRGGITGQELITAVAVGVDVAAGLGLASCAGMRFFRPATAGGFGAVAAAGRILGLDQPTLAAAFAWQLAQASGTMQPHHEGSPILPVQIGFNARAALHSCDFAALGFAAPRDVFEGPYGYLPLFEGDWDLAPVLQDLGRVWRIAEFSHKPYPAGRATHAGIEGVMALRDQHHFTAADVVSVRVTAPSLILRLVGRPATPTPDASYARLCLGYVVAKVLQHGALDIAHFRGAARADPITYELASRVSVTADDNPDPNAMAPQAVMVRLTDGTELSWHCNEMLAHPTRRLDTWQQLVKFGRCLEFAAQPLDQSVLHRLVDTVDRLEELSEVRTLTGLLAPARSE
jgi:2-methylcitrate dehydratase PrpD